MSLQSYNPKSPKYLPRYLERYAAEVDDWHREALACRTARAARQADASG